MEEQQDWTQVIIWNMPDGFTLKWDPHRKLNRWTAIGPQGSLGDYATREDAMYWIEWSSAATLVVPYKPVQ